MDKKAILSALIGVVIFSAAWFLYQGSRTDLAALEGQITYYYGKDCPHCLRVLQFVESNQIESRVPFVKKEVTASPENSREFLAVGKKCGLPPEELGAVPMIYADGQCLVGEPEAVAFFKRKAGIGQ